MTKAQELLGAYQDTLQAINGLDKADPKRAELEDRAYRLGREYMYEKSRTK